VHQLLIEQATYDPLLARTLVTGLDWLQTQARREIGSHNDSDSAFGELSEEQREALITRTSMAPEATIPRHFFRAHSPTHVRALLPRSSVMENASIPWSIATAWVPGLHANAGQ
jgi:hypothetical protein